MNLKHNFSMTRLLPLLLAGFLLSLSSTEGWSLPPCPEDQDAYYDNCFGSKTWSEGGIYDGEWADNKRNGKGTWTLTDEETYVGEFKDGLFHGQGTYTWANGDKYVGEYKDDARHGHGAYYFVADGPNQGDKHLGEWRNGLPNGHGTYIWASGEQYVGGHKGGVGHGHGTRYAVDGSILEKGYWEDGELVRPEPSSDGGTSASEPFDIYESVKPITPCWEAIQTMEDGKAFRECERLFKEEGDSEAAFSLYHVGMLMEEIPMALHWLLEATSPSKKHPQGYPRAQYEMGKISLYGKHGITLDYDIAQNLFLTAASQNFMPAFYEWARMAEKGWGFESADIPSAVLYYSAISSATGYSMAADRLAALCGDASSAYKLAQYYLIREGKGLLSLTEPDSEEAYLFFSISSHLGHDEAGERASTLREELSEAQILAANEYLHRWAETDFSKTACHL